jgi:polyferredoxin
MIENRFFRWMRWIILGLIVINMFSMFNRGAVHALCPYGGLETLYQTSIKSSSQLLLFLTTLLTVFFRRSFCGLVCPFGAIQEFVGKFQKQRWLIPRKVDRYLRYIKYFVLFITLWGAWTTISYWWVGYDPYYSYSLLIKNMSGMSPKYIFGSLVLLFSLLGSYLFERFFCKYFCPLGAFYSIIGYFSPTRIVRNQKTCTHCNICSKVCPVNIDVAKEKEIISPECISCNECVNVCPKDGTLEIKIWKSVISVLVILVLTYFVFFGGFFLIWHFH